MWVTTTWLPMDLRPKVVLQVLQPQICHSYGHAHRGPHQEPGKADGKMVGCVGFHAGVCTVLSYFQLSTPQRMQVMRARAPVKPMDAIDLHSMNLEPDLQPTSPEDSNEVAQVRFLKH